MDDAFCFAGKILWALIWLMIGGLVVIMFAPVALILKRREERHAGTVQPDRPGAL